MLNGLVLLHHCVQDAKYAAREAERAQMILAQESWLKEYEALRMRLRQEASSDQRLKMLNTWLEREDACQVDSG